MDWHHICAELLKINMIVKEKEKPHISEVSVANDDENSILTFYVKSKIIISNNMTDT